MLTSQQPDLAVVVVSYNARDLLERCLRSVQASLGGYSHEIVVVDNASEDGSPELVASAFPNVTLVRSPENRGFAAGVNHGISASTARYVLLLNSDATIDGAAISALVRSMDEHPTAGAAGGMLLNPDGSFQGSYADFPTLASETILATGLSRWLLPATFPSHPVEQSQTLRTVDWVCGAVMLLRRRAIEEIGPFDEAFFMYAEEVDWCYRARQRGWSVLYVPEARIVHLIAGSYARAPMRRREQIYRSKWLYLRKNSGLVPALAFRAAVHLASFLKLAGWAIAEVCSFGPRRDHARRNVESYRYLLANF
jgi:GT2 family glycosyltransferase